MLHHKIIISQPFNEQYELVIETNSKLIDNHMTSRTIMRYDFTVIRCNENEIECRLILLDLFLDQSNNDLVKEIAQVTAAFNRMFNELHLKLSQKGEILQVLNMDLVLSKWQQTKAEMTAALSNNDELRKLIAVNDSLFTNKEKLAHTIQNSEFLHMYFGQVFNIELPKTKRITGANILNTANLEWDMNISEQAGGHPDDIHILVNTYPVRPLSEGYLNAAYGQFKDRIDLDLLNFTMFQKEERYIDRNTGKLKQAIVEKVEEIGHEQLYQKFSYQMISDTEKKIQQKTALTS
ncbi:hypothetical protein [Chryseobacterium arthrosphaerae]|uniref:Uncharacterized protein n=1 Tax=Chryseobacterium arthrosphaerae TaxID=651561 RepID=A0A1B8ZQL7_9FLAO|nr:hypothetical protein [Chryseobacterium arthrosphaerae]OCA73867.1 hypothetical protein BBI00_05710 [Chryseobacterium arthrosphaerae]